MRSSSWTRWKGLRRGPSGGVSAGEPYADDAREPAKALACAEREGAGIFFFRELGPFLEDPLVASHVLDLVSAFGTKRGALIISGHDVRLPDVLRPHATTLRLAGPVYDDYRTMLERVIRDQTARMPVRIELTAQDRVRLINNLAGLTLIEAEKIVTKLLIEDAALRPDDIQRVIVAKRQAVEQDGLLEYYQAGESLSSVAGF